MIARRMKQGLFAAAVIGAGVAIVRVLRGRASANGTERAATGSNRGSRSGGGGDEPRSRQPGSEKAAGVGHPSVTENTMHNRAAGERQEGTYRPGQPGASSGQRSSAGQTQGVTSGTIGGTGLPHSQGQGNAGAQSSPVSGAGTTTRPGQASYPPGQSAQPAGSAPIRTTTVKESPPGGMGRVPNGDEELINRPPPHGNIYPNK
jgi:hypothetical protein